MAFSIRKRGERRCGAERGLLDVSLMQSLQDRFCDANNVYLVCLSKRNGVVTRAYGSKEELAYIHSLVNTDMHVSLMNKLLDHSVESPVEEDCGTDLVKMCGIAIHAGGETAAAWIAIGIMERESANVPRSVMRTTPERYYKSLEFLETLSRQIFAAKMEQILAQEAFLKSRESEAKMEAELHRNEVLTSVVKMLESESSFAEIGADILKNVCEYLDVSDGALVRECEQGGALDVVCEFFSPETEPIRGRWGQVPKREVPFFDGKSHIISTNAMTSEKFCRFFEREELRAGIFLPVDVEGKVAMYLCFFEQMRERIWDAADVKFVNDVKRIIQSILTKRMAEDSLASSYTSLEAILENVGCGICVHETDSGSVLYVNQHFRDSAWGKMQPGELARCIVEHQSKNGTDGFGEVYSEDENHWFDYRRTRTRWVDGREVVLCTIYDVTDKKLDQQKIERQANNDFLTGLFNRMRCGQDLEYYIRQAGESGGEGALLYIDLDDFKHINEGLGHQYGDMLLKNISDGLSRISGVEHNCYRMGGDEFIIILAHQNFGMLQKILDEVQMLFTRPWMLKDTNYYCTMSMGVVRFPTDGGTVDDLIRKADIALYRAKCAGKNRVEFYSDNVESASIKRLDMEKNMRNATQNCFSEFEVYYQPIVDITKPGEPCIGAEALIRWDSNELGLIAPTEFIPLAEYLGLINPIGEFVLKEACRSCKHWNDMGHPEYRVNVNLSVVQLLQNDIVDRIAKVVTESRILPANLVLEVTESLAINDMNRMKKVLADIRSLGVRVALDDFGTGYSSLNHIREMPIDIIKIDRCFILDIGRVEYQKAFVRMVAELAQTINMKVCVEGVETEDQLLALKETKIQCVQGFYFGRPMHLQDFEKKYL